MIFVKPIEERLIRRKRSNLQVIYMYKYGRAYA